jgi:hypothetical protein
MSLGDKYRGDSGSVGEELFMNVSELEEKGAVVDKAVREGYFSLQEALHAYELSELEYLSYSLLKDRRKLEGKAKEKEIWNAIVYLVDIYQAPSASFDTAGKQFMQKLKTLIGSKPLSQDEVNDLANSW